MTVFQLQIIYKLQTNEMKSSCQSTCAYVYWTTGTQTSGVIGLKSLTFLIGLQNYILGEHSVDVWALSYIRQAKLPLFWNGGSNGLCIIKIFLVF